MFVVHNPKEEEFSMRIRLLLMIVFVFISGISHATVTFFDDWSSFSTEYPNIITEGFEEGSIVNTNFHGPLDSMTDNGIFSPGDIMDGLRVWDTTGYHWYNMRLVNSNPSIGPLPSKVVVTPNSFIGLEVSFYQDDVFSMGMDVYDLQGYYGSSNGNIDVYIYGENGLLGSTVLNSSHNLPAFLGFESDLDPIKRVSVYNQSKGVSCVGLDNVAFKSVTPAPEPESLLLLLTGIIGMAGLFYKRNSPI
jgi:hypothetical protein